MNTVTLGGNLTEEPELRYTGQDTPVANVTLATNERYKDRNGELQEDAVFHDLVIWGPQAEVLKEYADKGQFLVVRGTIETNEWEDSDGNQRRDKEVKVLEFDFGPRQDTSPSASGGEQGSGGEDEEFVPDDELPF